MVLLRRGTTSAAAAKRARTPPITLRLAAAGAAAGTLLPLHLGTAEATPTTLCVTCVAVAMFRRNSTTTAAAAKRAPAPPITPRLAGAGAAAGTPIPVRRASQARPAASPTTRRPLGAGAGDGAGTLLCSSGEERAASASTWGSRRETGARRTMEAMARLEGASAVALLRRAIRTLFRSSGQERAASASTWSSRREADDALPARTVTVRFGFRCSQPQTQTSTYVSGCPLSTTGGRCISSSTLPATSCTASARLSSTVGETCGLTGRPRRDGSGSSRRVLGDDLPGASLAYIVTCAATRSTWEPGSAESTSSPCCPYILDTVSLSSAARLAPASLSVILF